MPVYHNNAMHNPHAIKLAWQNFVLTEFDASSNLITLEEIVIFTFCNLYPLCLAYMYIVDV